MDDTTNPILHRACTAGLHWSGLFHHPLPPVCTQYLHLEAELIEKIHDMYNHCYSWEFMRSCSLKSCSKRLTLTDGNRHPTSCQKRSYFRTLFSGISTTAIVPMFFQPRFCRKPTKLCFKLITNELDNDKKIIT